MIPKPVATQKESSSASEYMSEPDSLRVVDQNAFDNQKDAMASTASELSLAARRDEDLDNGNADDVILANPQWGAVSMLAAIQSLGGIIPGAGIIEAAFSNTFRTVEMHGEFSISNGSGSLEEYFLEQDGIVDSQGRKKDDEDDGGWDRYIEIAEQRAEQREMEEWQRETHSFAGQDMTGKQWGELTHDIKPGTKGYDWLINYLMEKGQTRTEAAQYAKDLDLAAEGMATPHPTQAQKDAQTRIDANPQSDGILKDLKAAQSHDFPPVSEKTTDLTNTAQKPSVNVGANSMYEDFPSAPDLTGHHAAAVAAIEPLDVKAAAPKLAAATPAPQPSSSAGLDI